MSSLLENCRNKGKDDTNVECTLTHSQEWKDLLLEMSNARVAFDDYDGKPKGYKFVSTHLVFDFDVKTR